MAHQARKRFGQHFLADLGVIDQIVRAIAPQSGQALIEIGPGLGALTLPLLAQCQPLTVIELDRDLAQRLRRQAGLNVMEADVLNVDFVALSQQWPTGGDGGDGGGGGDRGDRGEGLGNDAAAADKPATSGRSSTPLRIVGNLPYNISTPILFHLLQAAAVVQDQHFMLQKEVVQRMAASPGGNHAKDYGRLSVMLQWRYAIEHVLDVPPEAFEPPPRVDSAVVRMLPLPVEVANKVDAKRLSALVTSAFSQRRKLLRHTLGKWLEEQGMHSNFDLQRRAEEVPVAEYLALAQRV